MLLIRRATVDDLDAIWALMNVPGVDAPRDLATNREGYSLTFQDIEFDPNQLLIVAELGEHGVIGTMQLSFLPIITDTSGWRLNIENFRLSGAHRGGGYAEQMLEWAKEEGRRRGCAMAQVNSHTSMTAAHVFYESLGFKATHLGLKAKL